MLVLGLGSVAVVAQDKKATTAGAVTDEVQAFYKNMRDYQARFEQVYTDVAAGKDSRSGGRVYFKKPGKMRWDYLNADGSDKSLHKVLVSNGSEFTIYEAEHDQYYRQCLKDSKLPTALRFLMGTGDLKEEFDIELGKKSAAGTHKLELTPKKSSGKYKRIIFVVDAESFSVRETLVYDPYNNINRIIFHKPLTNKSLPDSGFDFSPPKDARPLGNTKELKCD
jgi:outer membrane lipoprotein carrier protein